MAMPLRDYQAQAVEAALEWVRDRGDFGCKVLFTAPTGTGKGVIELEVAARLREMKRRVVILTPSLEVIRGFMERQGAAPDLSETALRDIAENAGIWTPTRFRNKLSGALIATPDVVIVDEVHHFLDDNTVPADLDAFCSRSCWIGYTATPFRSSAVDTDSFIAKWGAPHTILSRRAAIDGGYMAMPRFHVVPILDDDELEVRGGEFLIKSADTQAADAAERVAGLVLQHVHEGRFDLPTAVAVPGAASRDAVLARLGPNGTGVHAATPFGERTASYEACRNRRAALVQVGIIGEGVDFPWLRRLIDAKPTLSPVAWLQLLGRITRPGEASEYICINRNVERHAWLVEDVAPLARKAAAQTQEEFGGPCVYGHAGHRALAIAGLSRHQACHVKLRSGGYAVMYVVGIQQQLDDVEGWTQWLIVLLPGGRLPLCFTRRNPRHGDYGKWSRAEPPADGFRGFVSAPWKSTLSDKQRAWWSNRAKHLGLADEADQITSRQFTILPALSDCRLALR